MGGVEVQYHVRMRDLDLIRSVSETVSGYLELGNETIDADGARFVRNHAMPRRYDANHVSRITCAEPEAIDRAIARADDEYADLPYRRFDTDPLTPPAFIARLVLDGYAPSHELKLVLQGELHAEPKACDIREVAGEAAWHAYEEMQVLDFAETCERQGRAFDASLMPQFTAFRRAKAPDVRAWLAHVDGEPVAYFSSWPGTNGVGMVEDLFTRKEFRHRGIATALVAHCVADARDRGAGPVVIGADPTDTPMHMYAAMGFRPLMLTSNFFKTVAEPSVMRTILSTTA